MWLVIALSAPALARAQPTPPATPPTQSAAAAYTAGSRAFAQGDYSTAAEYFETADRTVPSAQAAVQAIRAHRGARSIDHDARAATLAQRLLVRFATDTRVTGYAYHVIDELSPTLGRLTVHCGGCDLAVDDRTSEPDVFLSPGRHRVRAAWGTRVATRVVDLTAGGTERVTLEAPLTEIPLPPAVDITPPAQNTVTQSPETERLDTERPPVLQPPPTAPQSTAPPPSGLSPAVFITGSVVTAGLGAALIWSALDTLDGRDAYVQNPTVAGLDDGRSRELRTNVLIGATAGVGLATIVVGAFFTRWRHRSSSTLEASVGPGTFSLRGTF